jgi:hypothetical protein
LQVISLGEPLRFREAEPTAARAVGINPKNNGLGNREKIFARKSSLTISPNESSIETRLRVVSWPLSRKQQF